MKTVGILNGNMFYHFETKNPTPETEIEGNCIVENLYYDQKILHIYEFSPESCVNSD